MSRNIKPPRTQDWREREKWEEKVSKTVDQAQTGTDIEMLAILVSENNRPTVTTQDLQDARIEQSTQTYDAQSARTALQAANDAALLAIMGGW